MDDIEGQLADNYGYDEIGNLNRDDAEKIANIEWNTYGKVKRVKRELNSGKADLYFPPLLVFSAFVGVLTNKHMY